MPEVLTKHPKIVRSMLEQAGGRCGDGQPQKLLKSCPAEQFCTVPGGEMCIYDVAQARSMTQITLADFREQVCAEEATASLVEAGSCGAACGVAAPGSVDLGLAGVLLGAFCWRRLGRERRPSR